MHSATAVRKAIIRGAAASAWALWLGCGGGGGSSDSNIVTPPTPEPPPTPTACATISDASPIKNVQTDYGATPDDGTDDTAAIQNAINAVSGTGGTVVVPSGTYLINTHRLASHGLELKSNMSLHLLSGATLKAITNNYDTYVVVLASNITNAKIYGEGTIEGDRPAHTGSTGEAGMCLQLENGANNLVIQGITLKNAWGDGIYVNNATASGSQVTICGVTADSNRRSGMSIVQANGLTITNSTMKNAIGFLQSGSPICGTGLNIEPNSGNTVQHVEISDCTFTGNQGGGISSGVASGVSAQVHDIAITGNTVTGNGLVSRPRAGIEITGATTVQTVSYNAVAANIGIGIYVRSGASQITVASNQINNTSRPTDQSDAVYGKGSAIVLANVTGPNAVTSNTGSGNQGYGIHLFQASGTTRTGNTVTGTLGPYYSQ